MIAVLLTIFLNGRHVRCDPNEVIQELDQRMHHLVDDFRDDIQELYYAARQEAEASNNLPLIAVLVEAAKLELSQHQDEKESLSTARNIIQRYFLSSSSQYLHGWPPETDSLIDLIIKRSVQRACESQIVDVLRSRQRLNLLLKRHGHQPGVRESATKCAQRIRNRKFRVVKARAIVQDALERYTQVAAPNFASADQPSEILETIDSLIDECKSQVSNLTPTDTSDHELQMDLAATERALIGRVVRPRESKVESITRDDLEIQENLLIETHQRAVLSDINHRLDLLKEKFAQNMRRLFLDPVPQAEAEGNYPLMLLSARMAECEAIMYTAEYRMLMMMKELIRRLFIDMSEPLNETLVQNSNLIDLLIQRAVGFALETALKDLTDHRKRIYLRLLGYDYGHLKDLARTFYLILKERKARLNKADADSLISLRRYRNELAFVLPDHQMMLITLRTIDQLVDEAVKQGNIHIMRTNTSIPASLKDKNYLLRRFVGPDLMDSIISVQERTIGKVAPEVDPEWIDSFDIQQVEEYEDRMAN